MDLKTQPNEKRCHSTSVEHVLSLPECCPMTKNPKRGSEIKICYQPQKYILEVAALRAYIDSYVGGRGDVRSMEGMIQKIVQDSADCIGAIIYIEADLILDPKQRMIVRVTAFPNEPKLTGKARR